PTKEEFDAVEFLLWRSFELALMLIAMVGMIIFSLKHIPHSRSAKKRNRRTQDPPRTRPGRPLRLSECGQNALVSGRLRGPDNGVQGNSARTRNRFAGPPAST